MAQPLRFDSAEKKLLLFNIASGILLAASFLLKPLAFLPFICYIPFFLGVIRFSGKKLALVTVVFSISFWLSHVHWLLIFHPLALPLTILGLTIYLFIFAFLTRFAITRYPKFRFLIFPVFWLCLEYLSSLGYLGFPWGLAGGSVHFFLPFIQIADITGVWGVSFLVILINALLLEGFLFFRSGELRKASIPGSVALIILVLTCIYGSFALHAPEGKPFFKAGLIQGNIDPNINWDQIRYRMLDRTDWLSKKALKDKPDLIVWWETPILDYLIFYLANYKNATNPKFLECARYDQKILQLPRKYKTPLLLGVPDIIRKGDGYSFLNSAILVDTNAMITGQYSKIHLVPFGEWFPLKDMLPGVKKLLDSLNAGDYSPGMGVTLFETAGRKFTVLICYEGIFGDLARIGALNGSDVMINITDEMWSFSRIAQLQDAYLDVFRAIENRISYFRCGNSGATCFIAPSGRIEKMIPMFEPGVLTAIARDDARRGKTFYTRHGDWLPKVSLLLAGFALLISLISTVVMFLKNRPSKTP
jgi:apolipoprotein N-acyltransferase